MSPSLPESVAAFREAYRRDEIGPRYRGWLHFAFTSAASLAVIAFAASRVHEVRPLEWLVLPIGFLVANLAEYFGHKGPMHNAPSPRAHKTLARFLTLLFTRHTRQHHRFFTHEAMTYASSRDFKMVLFPPVMLFFFLGVLASPIALLLYVAISPNAGFLFVALATSYFLTYEWLHFVYHLPERSLVARLPLVAALRRHHTKHHELETMSHANFNITFPIADWIFGTLAVSAGVARFRSGARPRGRSGPT